MDKNLLGEYLEKFQEMERKLGGGVVDQNFEKEIINLLGMFDEDIKKNTHVEMSNTLPVKFKKLSENATSPSYSKDGDAGLDLTITSIINETDNIITYGTDLAFEIPYGYVGFLYPRSSIRKYDLMLTNSVGVIDSNYRGEIMLSFKKTISHAHQLCRKYEIGNRGAQIIIMPHPKVNFIESKELTSTERGKGGFGSSGK